MIDTNSFRKLLGYLEYKIDMSQFAERKILQKRVYLVQSVANIDLGFRFQWYMYGPYSSQLADMGYANNSALYPKPLNYIPSRKLVALKSLFDKHKKDSTWFEIAASLVFLHKELEFEGDGTIEKMIERLNLLKPELVKKVTLTNNETLAEYIRSIWLEVLPLIA
jgi:uncharacterized protein YwgA